MLNERNKSMFGFLQFMFRLTIIVVVSQHKIYNCKYTL
jgi:hypothetical protein